MELEFSEDELIEHKNTCPWIIRFIFDKEIMMEKGIVMEDVYLSLMNYDNEKLYFKYADDNSKELIGRISLIADEVTTNGIQDQSGIISVFKNIHEDIMNNVFIKGIKHISDVVVVEESNYDGTKNEYIKKNILLTDGINLLKIMNCEYVDFLKTYSNDIIEMNNILGIEASRNILFQEIMIVLDDADEYINNRHIEILCDIMTSKGELTSINRQGINRGDIGPLAKCSFEDTTDQLIKSSIFSEKDNLTGVSSNIMLGQTIKSGTGLCDIFLDEDQLMLSLKDIGLTEESFLEVDEDNIDILLDYEEADTDCDHNSFKFSFE
jgi:DNA-directed RNA polymerase II subunit RPB1